MKRLVTHINPSTPLGSRSARPFRIGFTLSPPPFFVTPSQPNARKKTYNQQTNKLCRSWRGVLCPTCAYLLCFGNNTPDLWAFRQRAPNVLALKQKALDLWIFKQKALDV